jgi:hypothetical protein
MPVGMRAFSGRVSQTLPHCKSCCCGRVAVDRQGQHPGCCIAARLTSNCEGQRQRRQSGKPNAGSHVGERPRLLGA